MNVSIIAFIGVSLSNQTQHNTHTYMHMTLPKINKHYEIIVGYLT